MQYFAKTYRFRWIDLVKLKQDLKYKGYVYFEPVRQMPYTRHIILKHIILSLRMFPFRRSLKQQNYFSGIDEHPC